MAFIECEKKDLPEGPWIQDIKDYPEKVYEFKFEGGITGTVRRQRGWNWNGYVSLPSWHPDFAKEYAEIEDDELFDVHGGITYGPGDGTFGFDTSHITSGDLVPAEVACHKHPVLGKLFSLNFTYDRGEKHFWTFEDTKKELKRFAHDFYLRQIAE